MANKRVVTSNAKSNNDVTTSDNFNVSSVNKSDIEKESKSVSSVEAIKNRTNRTTFQARLGRHIDVINRKVLDNSIRLTGHPTDMLRVKANRDPRTQDLISREITKSEVVPVILPQLKNVPLRQLTREGTSIKVPSLFTIDQNQYFEIYTPASVQLDMDDLLIRILWSDDLNVDLPYIFVMQVSEILGTFGHSSLQYLKYFATFYDEKLPDDVIKWIKNCNIKRETLNW